MRDALHWFDRAVELVRSASAERWHGARALVDLHERRGAARAQAGQTEGAVADIRVVIDAARARGDRAKARDALIQLGMTYRRADDYGQAIACLTEALDECRAHERRAACGRHAVSPWAPSCGATAATRRRSPTTRRRSRSASASASPTWSRCRPTTAAARRTSRTSSPRRRSPATTARIELARGIGDKSYESENLMMIAYACTGSMGLGDYAQAQANFEAALEIAQRADLQWHMGPTLLGLDHVRACIGRLRRGLDRHDADAALAGEPEADALSVHRLRFPRRISCSISGSTGKPSKLRSAAWRWRATARIMFWRQHIEANLAIASMRLGDLDVGPALEGTLRYARENCERSQMVRCLEGLAELALIARRCRGMPCTGGRAARRTRKPPA